MCRFGIVSYNYLLSSAFFKILLSKFLFAKLVGKKEGVWILGGGWNNDLWGGEMPTSNWIDDISPQNPVKSKPQI